MTWTYTDTLLTARDRIRAAVGDTNTNDQLKSDEFIAGVLAQQSLEGYAAAAVAESIAADFARKADLESGQTKVSASQKSKAYEALAARLRAAGGSLFQGDGTPTLNAWSGGTSLTERDALTQDSDRIQPSFKVGMDDAPGTGVVTDPRGWWRW